MMDRIIVTAADIEKLLAWRDEHKELVRSMPVPLREVKIQIVESGIIVWGAAVKHVDITYWENAIFHPVDVPFWMPLPKPPEEK